MVEQQTVLAATGHGVQREADLPEEALRSLEPPHFGGRQEAEGGELVEGLGAEVALGDPGDGLDVAQSTRTCLDVGFQVVGGVVRLGVPVGLLADLGLEEFFDRPEVRGGECLGHPRGERSVSGHAARLDEGGHHAHIAGGGFRALGDGAHAVTDLDADVPQEGDERLERRAPRLVERGRHQDQDVDIGGGVQLAATVATHRDERPIFIVIGQPRAPSLA